MLDLAGEARPLERTVFLRMRGAPLFEPGDSPWNPFREWRPRLPAEHLARPADVGHVVGDLAKKGWCRRDLWLDGELRRDQLGRANEGVPLAVGEVDRLVRDSLLR